MSIPLDGVRNSLLINYVSKIQLFLPQYSVGLTKSLSLCQSNHSYLAVNQRWSIGDCPSPVLICLKVHHPFLI